MDIFIHTKFASSSEFKSNSNVQIFSLIRHELSELCKFYKLYPEMEIFYAMPLVLQMAVIFPFSLKKLQVLNFLDATYNSLGLGHLLSCTLPP